MSNHRTLPDPLNAYRIGDPKGEHPIYSGEGSALYPGRWNAPGEDVIYASEHYSTAMLEKLVHYSGQLPPNQHFVEIVIPQGVTYEVVTKDSLKGWSQKNGAASKRFGSEWFNKRRSAILLVPSVVARIERNVLINPRHKDAALISPNLESPVWWDERLFD